MGNAPLLKIGVEPQVPPRENRSETNEVCERECVCVMERVGRMMPLWRLSATRKLAGAVGLGVVSLLLLEVVELLLVVVY